MIQSVACILLFSGFAVSGQVININNDTDKLLANVGDLMTAKGMGLRHFRPVVEGGLLLSRNVVIGANSLFRTGDCTLTLSENHTMHFDYHLGFRLLETAHGLIRFKDDRMSGAAKVNKNSVHLSFTIHNETVCSVTIEDYEFEILDKVSFSSSMPKYDGKDLSEFVKTYALPRLNKILTKKIPELEAYFEEKICHHRDLDGDVLPEFDFLSNYI